MKYRLKKEAAQFFNEKHATSIYDLSTWESLQVDMNALEKVEPAYISYGIATTKTGSSLGGWSQENKSHFHFTINFPSMNYQEYDKFNKGQIIRKLIDKFQTEINWFYQNFVNEELEGDNDNT